MIKIIIVVTVNTGYSTLHGLYDTVYDDIFKCVRTVCRMTDFLTEAVILFTFTCLLYTSRCV